MKAHLTLAAAVVATAIVAAPKPAHAEIGIGVFIGEPLGLTLKVDLNRRTALEVLLGESSIRHERSEYGHITALFNLFNARGSGVLIPFRLGIGGAIYDDDDNFDDDINVAARFPFEVAFRFRAPIELYFEVALLLEVIDSHDNNDLLDVDGGIGFRFYF
jgi:hypothetical protein